MSHNGQAASTKGAVEALQHLPQPVLVYASDYPAGHLIPPHRHPRAQLIHAAEGVMTVRTGSGAWVVPPGLALWMPGGVEHEVHAVTPLRMRTIYVRPDAAPWLPESCRVVTVTPLLRELILRAVRVRPDYEPDSPEGRLMQVTLDQAHDLEEAPLHLPMPRDRRLRALAEALIADPGDERDLTSWGRHAGASERTLARLFQTETGLTFGAWRQRLRLLSAMTRLAAGEPVTSVALDLGYASPSAFTAMFRRQMGAPPSRYLQKV